VTPAFFDFSPTLEFVSRLTAADGGQRYRLGEGPTTSTSTAASILVRLFGGQVPARDEQQAALRWLSTHYRVDQSQDETGAFSTRYHAAYLYLAALALSLSHVERRDLVDGDDVGGVRAPADDGYPEMDGGWAYDFGWYLVTTQGEGEAWCNGEAAPCEASVSATALALLTLSFVESAVLATLVPPSDADQDGIIDEEDLCPEVADSGDDADGDGVGDACDNCPQRPNADQADADEDGVGDACPEATPSPEACDGLDEDGDGEVDEFAPCPEGARCEDGACRPDGAEEGDTGVTPPDAAVDGAPGEDGAAAGPDAFVPPFDDRARPIACSCHASSDGPAGALPWLCLLALGARRRRR